MPTPTGTSNAMLRLLMGGGMTEQPTERTQLLPLGKYQDGSVGLAVPGAVMDVGNAMFRGMTTDHGNALSQPDPDVRNQMMRQSIADALTVAGAATTGSMAMPRPAGSIGMGGRPLKGNFDIEIYPGHPVPILNNPSPQRLKAFISQTPHKAVRVLDDPETGMRYVWPADSSALHKQIADKLGIKFDPSGPEAGKMMYSD